MPGELAAWLVFLWSGRPRSRPHAASRRRRWWFHAGEYGEEYTVKEESAGCEIEAAWGWIDGSSVERRRYSVGAQIKCGGPSCDQSACWSCPTTKPAKSWPVCRCAYLGADEEETPRRLKKVHKRETPDRVDRAVNSYFLRSSKGLVAAKHGSAPSALLRRCQAVRYWTPTPAS